MPRYQELSPEEARRVAPTLWGQEVDTVSADELRASYYQQREIQTEQAIMRSNLAKNAGVKAYEIPIDSEQTVKNTLHDIVQGTPTWEELSNELPATSNAWKEPDTMAATIERGPEFGFFESVVQGYAKKSRYNQIDRKLNEAAIQLNNTNMSKAKQADLLKRMRELSAYQQKFETPTGWKTVPFIASNIGRQLVDLAGTVKNGFVRGAKEYRGLKMVKWASAGAVAGAISGAGAASPATAGVGAGIGVGLGAAYEPAKAGIESGFNYSKDMAFAMAMRMGVDAGISNIDALRRASNVAGFTVAVLNAAGTATFAKFGFKGVGSVISKSSIPMLNKIAENTPATKLALKQITSNISKYSGKTLENAIATATVDLVKANAVAFADNYAQNFATKMAVNYAAIQGEQYDKTSDFGDIAISSATEAILPTLIGAGTISLIGLGTKKALGRMMGLSESLAKSTESVDAIEGINAAIKNNDMHERAPHLAEEHAKMVAGEHEHPTVGIDITDFHESFGEEGTREYFRRAGLERFYQEAIEDGGKYAEIPLEKWSDAVREPVEENKSLSDLMPGSVRMSRDDLTANQAKRVDEFVKDGRKALEEIISENQVRHDEISAILKQRLENAYKKTGRTGRGIKTEAESQTAIVMKSIVRESQESGRSFDEVVDSLLPDIYGPIHLETGNRAAMRSRIRMEVMETAKNDPAYKVRQFVKKSKQKIFISPDNASDFSEVINAYPKDTFTTDMKKGIPWDTVSPELFGTSDMNEVIDMLSRGEFHTERKIYDLVSKLTDEEQAFNDHLKAQYNPGKTFASVDLDTLPRVINIFKGSNQSSFMHEMAHVFLQDKFEFVKSGREISEEYAENWGLIRDWLGIADDQETITTQQQETFARSFEAYLKNGEAPSKDLKSAFRNFRKWMLEIYSTIKSYVLKKQILPQEVLPSKEISTLRKEGWIIDTDLGININPKIRGFFDRMLATQDEIDQVRADLQSDSTWNELRKSGVATPLLRRLRRYSEDGNEKAFRRLVGAMSDELEGKYLQSREKFIDQQSNEKKDGTIANDMWRGGVYGYLKNWSTDKPGLFDDPDIAHMYMQGVASDVLEGRVTADELVGSDQMLGVKTILEAAEIIRQSESPSKFLESAVAEAAQEKYPVLMDSSDFHEKAMEAYHNRDTITALIAEHEALKQLGELPTNEEILRDIEIPELKAEHVEKLRAVVEKSKQKEQNTRIEMRKKLADQKEFMKWDKEQAVNSILYSALFDQLELKEKYEEKILRAKTEKMYEKLFIQSADKEIKGYFKDIRARQDEIDAASWRVVSEMTLPQVRKALRELITKQRNHAVLSAKAVKDRNVYKAVSAKYEQILAASQYRAAVKQARLAERHIRSIYKTATVRKDLMKNQVHLDAMIDLLGRFGVKHSSFDDFFKTTFPDWYNTYFDKIDLPYWLGDPELYMDIKALSLSQLHDLYDTTKAIRKIANDENTILIGEKRRDFGEFISEISDYVRKKGLKVEGSRTVSEDFNYKEDIGNRVKGFISSAKVYMFRVETLALAFGDVKNPTKNPIWRAITDPLRESRAKYEARRLPILNHLSEYLEKLNLPELHKKYVDAEWEKGRKLSMYEVLGIAHFVGTESGLDRVVTGFSNMFGDHWTNDYVNTILDKYMTPEMWDYIREYGKVCDEIFSGKDDKNVVDTYLEIEGFAPRDVDKRVMAVKVRDESGNIKSQYVEGWYAPLKRDKNFATGEYFDQYDLPDSAAYHTLTANGYTKARSAWANYVVDIDPIRGIHQIDLVLRDIYYRKNLLGLNKLLKSNDFKNIWSSKHGDESFNDLKNYFEFVATNGNSENSKVANLEKYMDVFARSTSVATMAWNIRQATGDLSSLFFTAPYKLGFKSGVFGVAGKVAKIAPGSIFQSAADIGNVIMNNQAKQLEDTQHFSKHTNRMLEKSLVARDRMKSRSTDIYDYFQNKKRGRLLNSLIFGFYHTISTICESAVWNESYDRAIAMGIGENKAVKIANSNLVQIFTSAAAEDRPKVLRQTTGWRRALNLFMSWAYTQVEHIYLAGQEMKEPLSINDKIGISSWVAANMFLMPVATSMAMGDRKNDDESWLQYFVRKDVDFWVRPIPIVGNLISRNVGLFVTGQKEKMRAQTSFAFTRPLESALEAMLVREDAEFSEKLEKWSNSATYWPGVPWATQANVLLWNAHDIMTGEMEAKPIDLMVRRKKADK
jgi:hypothetical protein